MSTAFEVNFDGLPGPTHTYSGLAFGDKASMENAKMISNPKACALQSLDKMQLCLSLGLKQAILPPHERPALFALRNLGFTGDTQTALQKLFSYSPEIFLAINSAAAMWTANSATVTPSSDTVDQRVHFTPANLAHEYHRSIEAVFTDKLLRKIFNNEKHFMHYPPLSGGTQFSDEGAANHTRLCAEYSMQGIHLFVYGDAAFSSIKKPKHFPGRQHREASEAIARRHGILEHAVFLQQNPAVIDKGIFHNDVIATGNEKVFIYHEHAFLDIDRGFSSVIDKIPEFSAIKISDVEFSVDKAVETYLFNSQLVTLQDKSMAILAPKVCEIDKQALQVLKRLVAEDNPIQKLYFVDCSHSVRNGGGPACLRLRVVLTEAECKHVHPGVMLDEAKILRLKQWVEKYYRDRLAPKDLLDADFQNTNLLALDELTNILQLGNIYPFQL